MDICDNSNCVDADSFLPILRTVHAFSRTLYHAIVVLDFSNGKCLYVSANPAVLSNLDRDNLLSLGVMSMINRVPEEERHFVGCISSAVRQLLCSYPPKHNEDLVISSNFHLLLGEVSTMLNFRVTPLDFDDKGAISIVLCVISPSVHGEAGWLVACTKVSSQYWHYSVESNSWTELNMQHLITSDERTMLYLSTQGLPLKVIADRMHRSIDTVKSYRRRLFAKLGVSNITEAVTFAATYQLL